MDNEYNTHKLSELLKVFKDKKGLNEGLNQIEVKRAWREQMGPAIEKYTLKIYLKKHTLFVRLDSAVLREELSYGKSQIIQNLNESLGQELINKIVFS
jgi:hypothetical protein